MAEEIELSNDGAPKIIFEQRHVICAKHGKHPHIIDSTIEGLEGARCLKCLLELIGPALEVVWE